MRTSPPLFAADREGAIAVLGFASGFLSLLCLAAALLSFVPLPHGAFRTLDFPRLQFAALAALGAASSLLALPRPWPAYAFAAAGGIAFAIQLLHIIRFTPLWRRQVPPASDAPDRWSVSILACNVKQSNRQYGRMATLIRKLEPDLVLLMETDRDWVEAMRPALADYTHRTELPQENGYGMHIASRKEPASCEVRHLLNKEVPSIHLRLPVDEDCADVRVIMLHPEPPVPTDDTYGRDAEIARVAQITREDDSPIIVTGDLNDVAWSHTTRRFMRVSKLLDPRRGRGLFNSFDARYPFLRWPLDHIFHSSHFGLRRLERMPAVGSDHFPIYFELVLDRPAARDRDRADRFDLAEVEEVVSSEDGRDSRPHGADWER